MRMYAVSDVSATTGAGRSSKAAKVLPPSPLNGPRTIHSWCFRHSAAASNEAGVFCFLTALWGKLIRLETEWVEFPVCLKVRVSSALPRGTVKEIGLSARCGLSPGTSHLQAPSGDASPGDSR